jgi:hypothetical protein
MRVIGVMAFVLAVLLFIVAGAVGVTRWAVFDGYKMITDFLGESVVPALDFVKSTYNSLQINLQILLMLIGASAALFLITIFCFAVVNARKKRAIKASFKKVKGPDKKQDDDATKKAIPYLAAGIVVVAAIVAATVVLNKKKAVQGDCYCCKHS